MSRMQGLNGFRGFVVALLALLVLLGGCSGATTGDQPAGGDSGAAAADDALDAAGDQDAVAPAAGLAEAGQQVEEGQDLEAGRRDGASPMMVRRVTVDVEVTDVAAAVASARATALGAGGWVESEEVVPGVEDRPGHASLVLRVPSGDLDTTVASLGELGEVTFSQSSSEDVAAEYHDVDARIATLEAGAERLRELIADAGSVESIASLERELTTREADLDALNARLQVLEGDVSRSTITLRLSEPGAEPVAGRSGTGFGAGLERGWAAFTTSMGVLVTALGALLPFLVAAVLVALPVLAWRRRRRAVRSRNTPATPARIGSQGDGHDDAAGDPDRA